MGSSISGLEAPTQLSVLDVSINQLVSVSGVQHLTQLEEFWANDNRIADIEMVQPLTLLLALKTVYLWGCPLAKQSDYRTQVLSLLPPSLTQLDADMLPP